MNSRPWPNIYQIISRVNGAFVMFNDNTRSKDFSQEDWSGVDWKFWAGKYAFPKTYTVPGIYRFRLRLGIDRGFSIVDDVTIVVTIPR